VSLGGAAWGVKGWLIVAAWTAVLTELAARAYASDTQRV
jgi:ABC-2 type transport system permease protein